MMILDKWRENRTQVENAGRDALSLAKEADVPAYYMDDTLGRGIVKEMPDGRRFLVSYGDGRENVVAALGPRDR
ncbi:MULTISPECIES: hypothetical protein [unclassified Aureimonas]|uniref:hypothetical protein n=1 Tax=unclassified Aureimonas TaxID=2615206 RepID=UPI000700E755|nr:MULTISPECIES: hypothetical protein [unclassified Aureimonas]KQT69746.1 hypothetical protein ASG62_01100 [Aureimonas sp. Leaf427]KQT76102.1 hypothetical protein ASG54_15120 [Aureimonas sp. Leaf460]